MQKLADAVGVKKVLRITCQITNIFYKPTTQNLAQKVGLEQQDWFYTSIAFRGSSKARDEVAILIQSVLYNNVGIDKAYTDTINAILYS